MRRFGAPRSLCGFPSGVTLGASGHTTDAPNDVYTKPETVHLLYVHEQEGQLNITETARDESRGKTWEQVVRDGQEYRVWHDGGRPGMPTIVRFHKERTSIELQSGDFDREELFEIADSLMPATSPSP
jgi:hypothetical protein